MPKDPKKEHSNLLLNFEYKNKGTIRVCNGILYQRMLFPATFLGITMIIWRGTKKILIKLDTGSFYVSCRTCSYHGLMKNYETSLAPSTCCQDIS